MEMFLRELILRLFRNQSLLFQDLPQSHMPKQTILFMKKFANKQI